MEFLSIRTVESWGDYWHVLIGGMTGYLPRSNGKLRLLRTAPFAPPIVVSGIEDAIVTESFRPKLMSVSGVKGFLPVIKEKIVRLDWSTWKLAGDEPQLTCFAEPADSILSGTHDAQLSEEIGELYEVILAYDGLVDTDFDPNSEETVTFSVPPIRGYSLFKAETVGGFGVVIGTEQFVSSLPSEVKRWLEFTLVSVPGAT
jgi:hypothetical protein